MEHQFLLVRRRVSIGYIELLRGKYEPRDLTGILTLVNETTMLEREALMMRSFTDLWRSLWNGSISRRYLAEFEQAKAKFDVLKNRGTLATIIESAKTRWTEPEWGFPKGRRSSLETEIACALRETEEETGIARSSLTVLEGESPFLEQYVGSNGLIYRHKYWLAEAASNQDVRVDPSNEEQMREISAVSWLTESAALDIIRPYHKEKCAVLIAAAQRLAAKFGTVKAEE